MVPPIAVLASAALHRGRARVYPGSALVIAVLTSAALHRGGCTGEPRSTGGNIAVLTAPPFIEAGPAARPAGVRGPIAVAHERRLSSRPVEPPDAAGHGEDRGAYLRRPSSRRPDRRHLRRVLPHRGARQCRPSSRPVEEHAALGDLEQIAVPQQHCPSSRQAKQQSEAGVGRALWCSSAPPFIEAPGAPSASPGLTHRGARRHRPSSRRHSSTNLSLHRGARQRHPSPGMYALNVP